LAQLSSAAIALLWIAAIAVLGLADRLIDPLTPSIGAVLVFMVTVGTAYSLTRRRRLEQHLRAGGRPTHRRTTGPGQAQWRMA